MKKSLILLAFAALALAACGSDPVKPSATAQAKPAQESASADKRVEAEKTKRANCEKYTPIGSNRPQYRCRGAEEKKAAAEEDEREMRKATAPVAGGVGG